jgi:MFS transporter, ACS family, hexuronate transporter
VLAVFVLCSTVNFLDRQLLAALAPTIKKEFGLTNGQYGQILSAFAFTYTAVTPVFGWMMDRIGLSVGMTIAVGLWSLAGVATAFTRSFAGLFACRAALGSGESAGMPGLAKANGLYLKPAEYPASLAANHVTISLGAAAAPLLVALVAPHYGWRSVFVICGALGLLWIPLWLFTSSRIGSGIQAAAPPQILHSVLEDRRMWHLAFANALIMTAYAVWTSWTTIYLVQEYRINEMEANRSFAWIPPLCATAGGFIGAWLGWLWIRRGVGILNARMRVCWMGAAGLMAGAVLPFMPSPAAATAVICANMFFCMLLQTNLHSLPIDLFGPANAGRSVSVLAFSYGLTQVVISPLVGLAVDRAGFRPISALLAALPIAGVLVLTYSIRQNREVDSALTRSALATEIAP